MKNPLANLLYVKKKKPHAVSRFCNSVSERKTEENAAVKFEF